MYSRLCLLILATLSLSACASFKRGDLLAPIEATGSRQESQTTICLKVSTPHEYSWEQQRSKEFTRVVTQVFQQNGWRVTQSDNAPVAVNVDFSLDGYMYPEFTALYFLSIGTLPGKTEGYYTIDATLSIDGVEQDRVSYTDSMVTYFTCYGPIGLLVPGTTHRAAFDNEPSPDLTRQIYQRLALHLAADLRAKYFSGNYQKVAI